MADEQPHGDDYWGEDSEDSWGEYSDDGDHWEEEDEVGWEEDDLQPYKYSPISPEEIRCLVLEPGRGRERLSCTLTVHRLDDNPEYEAISYAWGKPDRCHTIRCDGGRMLITPNLRDALRQCRLPDRARFLWADSVCINQKDSEEKSHQVADMGRIYSQATMVLICLGPDRTGGCAQQAEAFLRRFNDMFEKTLEDVRGKWNAFPRPSRDDPMLSDPEWPSMASLVRQPWFERGWVVQEAALAKDALLIWGEIHINWLWMLRFEEWRARRATVPAAAFSTDVGGTHVNAYEMRYKEEAMTMWKEEDFPVFQLLPILDAARCLSITDKRDCIYAFLGLPEAANIRDSVSIDYNKTAAQVYQDFAVSYVDCTLDLLLLHYIEPAEPSISTDPQYPSWVPQWQTCVYIFPLYNPWYARVVSQCPSTSPPCSRAGTNILEVRGLITDSITFLSPPLSKEMTISDIAAVWRNFKAYGGKSIYEESPPIHAFLEALSSGLTPASLDAEGQRAEENAFLRRLDRDAPDAGEGDSTSSQDPGEDELDDELDYTGDLIKAHMEGYIHRRRVAVTRRGYYCLVSDQAQEGDTCAIIFGTAGPFILRSAGEQDHYKVVGEAFFVTCSRLGDNDAGEYINRVGSGINANEDWLDWGLEEQDIFLC